jgi:phosphoglycerate dehydrogenase-like enzyme
MAGSLLARRPGVGRPAEIVDNELCQGEGMLRVAVGPNPSDIVAEAVRRGGGTVVAVQDRPDALVWMSAGDAAGLRAALAQAPSVRWVQLPFAGVEDFAAADAFVPDITWTCAKDVYSEPVAEHALALALAGLRRLQERARATSWGEQHAMTLYDAPVVVLGGGGITTALLRLLAPFRARTTVVRRSGVQLPGADRTVTTDALDEVLPRARVVVLALALTPQTEHVIDARRLALMDEQAWLVNVARGQHVDTDALVRALKDDRIGGAALDVTDPEPLPDGHPLWSLPNALVTPHTANPWQTAQPLLASRITDNVRRFAAGEGLLGLVDVDAGY